LKVAEKTSDALLVTTCDNSELFTIPVHHLSDFATIAEAKHTLVVQGSKLSGLVANSKGSLSMYHSFCNKLMKENNDSAL